MYEFASSNRPITKQCLNKQPLGGQGGWTPRSKGYFNVLAQFCIPIIQRVVMDQEVSGLLEPPDLSQGHGAWTKPYSFVFGRVPS